MAVVGLLVLLTENGKRFVVRQGIVGMGRVDSRGYLGIGGDVISVLVEVAINICGLESEAISPSGLGIGLI